jgi:predicted TIM-barrel fold metal-dependent hydrolase
MEDQIKKEGLDRRKFLSHGGMALLSASMPGIITSPFPAIKDLQKNSKTSVSDFHRDGWKDMLEEAVKYRKIDSHNHLGLSSNDNLANMDKSCELLGITKAAVSLPGGKTPAVIRDNNNVILKAMKALPNRIIGQCYINPIFQKEALEEIDRCVDQGMVMLGELYDSCKINDPLYYPIIEKCIKLNIPLMLHGVTTLGNWRKGYLPTNPPHSSVPEDFVDIGRRYPEAMIICGHIGGGGNWEYVCRVLQDAPTIYLDTSGSVSDEGMVDMAIEYIGVDRLLFATDLNFETGVGKVMWATLSDSDRKKIFFDNFNNLLKKAGNHVN